MGTTHATRIADDLVLPHLAPEALDQLYVKKVTLPGQERNDAGDVVQ
ncbi:hypothetical protein [Lentzea sp. NPDC004782]